MPSLLARVDEDSDSDDDDNDDTTFTPNPLSTSKQTSLTTPPSLSSSSQLPTPNSNLTTIKLDTTMQYHLKDDKLESLKQRVTSRAIDITSKSTHTHTHPSLIPKRSWLMTTIQTIITSADRVMLPHKYKFENTREAAKYNIKLIKKQRYDFVRALDKEDGTMLELGSEFRLKSVLEPLLKKHEHWEKINEIITYGITYPLKDIPEKDREEDLVHMMARGSHKSA